MSDSAPSLGREADPEPVTEQLRERAEPAWTDATTHRFVEELGAGILDDEVFARYLIQDYAFLRTLSGTVGVAVDDAPEMDAKARLAGFLETLVGPENDYFERAFDALDVPESTWRDPDLAGPTRRFRHLFGHAADAGGYAETLAVLVPVEWVYLSWAQSVSSAADSEIPDRFYLAEWIDIHATEEFAGFVAWLRAELDREATALRSSRRQRIERLFVDAVELEVEFFDAAYGGED